MARQLLESVAVVGEVVAAIVVFDEEQEEEVSIPQAVGLVELVVVVAQQ